MNHTPQRGFFGSRTIITDRAVDPDPNQRESHGPLGDLRSVDFTGLPTGSGGAPTRRGFTRKYDMGPEGEVGPDGIPGDISFAKRFRTDNGGWQSVNAGLQTSTPVPFLTRRGTDDDDDPMGSRFVDVRVHDDKGTVGPSTIREHVPITVSFTYTEPNKLYAGLPLRFGLQMVRSVTTSSTRHDRGELVTMRSVPHLNRELRDPRNALLLPEVVDSETGIRRAPTVFLKDQHSHRVLQYSADRPFRTTEDLKLKIADFSVFGAELSSSATPVASHTTRTTSSMVVSGTAQTQGMWVYGDVPVHARGPGSRWGTGLNSGSVLWLLAVCLPEEEGAARTALVKYQHSTIQARAEGQKQKRRAYTNNVIPAEKMHAQWLPYICHDERPPPEWLYKDLYGRWEGFAVRVGRKIGHEMMPRGTRERVAQILFGLNGDLTKDGAHKFAVANEAFQKLHLITINIGTSRDNMIV